MLFVHVLIVGIASAVFGIASAVASFPNCYCAIVVEGRKNKEEERSQKIDDLPVLATCRSGTLAMLSSKVNGPVVHEGTR